MNPPFTLKMWKRVLDRLDLVPGDEELPGGNSGNSGMELIDSATISTPVEYLDIDLPSGYDLFQLYLENFFIEGSDRLGAAFSADGGNNFLSDQVNFDTYTTVSAYIVAASVTTEENVDALIHLGGNSMPETISPSLISIRILPGSAAVFAQLESFKSAGGDGGSGSSIELAWENGAFTNGIATYPKQRVNLLRIVPYGNSDIDPPTSGEEILSGKYTLYGAPTP